MVIGTERRANRPAEDATLLWLAPHLVLDGLQLAAEAVGADQAILYTHVDRRNDVAGGCGKPSPNASPSAPTGWRSASGAPAGFLSGQETALLSHLAGGPAIPPSRPADHERGLLGAPTPVQNAETLAHVALIARHGPRWFRQVRHRGQPGSMLCTIRRADERRASSRSPGIPLKALLSDVRADQAVLIGGYHGSWLPATEAVRLTLDNQSLAAAGARVGGRDPAYPAAGSVRADRDGRGRPVLALESAGQCGLCLNGLPRMAAALTEIGRRPPARPDAGGRGAAGPGWSPGAAPATTRTARRGSCAAR